MMNRLEIGFLEGAKVQSNKGSEAQRLKGSKTQRLKGNRVKIKFYTFQIVEMHSSASTHRISTKNVNDEDDDLKKGMKHFYVSSLFVYFLYGYTLRRRTAVRLYNCKCKTTKVQRKTLSF